MQPASKTSLHLILVLLVFLALLQLLLILVFILVLINRVAAADWLSEADPGCATARDRGRRIRGPVLRLGVVRWGRLLGRQVTGFHGQRRWEDGRVVGQEGRRVGRNEVVHMGVFLRKHCGENQAGSL